MHPWVLEINRFKHRIFKSSGSAIRFHHLMCRQAARITPCWHWGRIRLLQTNSINKRSDSLAQRLFKLADETMLQKRSTMDLGRDGSGNRSQ